MQLVVDIGNTRIKSYVFQNDTVIESSSQPLAIGASDIRQFLTNYKAIDNIIVSDVNGSLTQKVEVLLSPFPVVYCSSSLNLPFTTLYAPKAQLGADRIALLAASCLAYPNTNRLLIDLGSCITYDVIDSKDVHQGGAISPGYAMRYKSMHTFTGKLPNLTPEYPKETLGKSTSESMHRGVHQGIVNEIKGAIEESEKKHKDLTVILTGGDAERLPKPVKNSIFAHSNFIANGLNYILKLNTTL